jgi:hypothetical protein
LKEDEIKKIKEVLFKDPEAAEAGEGDPYKVKMTLIRFSMEPGSR